MNILMWMSGNFDRRTPSEHLLVAIVEALYKKGNTVHIIQKDTGGDLPKLPEALVKLGVTTDCIPCKLASKGNFIARYLVDVKYVLNCRSIIKKHKDCKAVFIQSSNVAGFMAYLVKRILPKAKLTYNVQDIFPENAYYTGKVKGIVYRILSAEQRYAYKKADNIITISEDMKDLLVEKGTESQKIHVIYNWSYQDELYSPERIYNDEIASMLKRDKFNVVYAGNIGVMQNVDIIVNAARITDDPNIEFHIFGDGVYKDKLVRLGEGLSNLHFWPMQPSHLAPSIYGMADVNIIPLSKNGYRTALPSKTATCLACQKPIIFCFDSQSKFGKWMEAEAGCPVVGCDDAQALKNAIKGLKEKNSCAKTAEMFKKNFQKTINSIKYSDIISGNTNL